jgi:hypothetical protein
MPVEVVSVAPNPKKDRWVDVQILRDGQPQKAICFTTKAMELKPGPLPEGWYVKEGDYGPIVEAPREAKAGGGGSSHEGNKFVQKEMNARTAIMQAVILVKEPGLDLFRVADEINEWLIRKGA